VHTKNTACVTPESNLSSRATQEASRSVKEPAQCEGPGSGLPRLSERLQPIYRSCLPAGEKALLAYLTWRIDTRTGRTWVGIARMVLETGLPRSTLKRTLPAHRMARQGGQKGSRSSRTNSLRPQFMLRCASVPALFDETCIVKVLNWAEDSELAQDWNPIILVADSAMSLPDSLMSSSGRAMESEQDLFAYHGLNAENELISALGDEIAREIDRTIINALFVFAGAGNTTWHSTVPLTGAYSLIDPKAYNRTIMDAIVDANANIKRKRYRNANWIVCGVNTATRLEKPDEFRLFPSADPVGTIVQGPNLFGTLSGRYSVYVDPWLDPTLPGGAEQMLLGYKGTTLLDTGYVYAPYRSPSYGCTLRNPARFQGRYENYTDVRPGGRQEYAKGRL
jgi:hypothetical protein